MKKSESYVSANKEFVTDKEFSPAFKRVAYYPRENLTRKQLEERTAEEVRTIEFYRKQGYFDFPKKRR